jgi:hypothetical protein
MWKFLRKLWWLCGVQEIAQYVGHNQAVVFDWIQNWSHFPASRDSGGVWWAYKLKVRRWLKANGIIFRPLVEEEIVVLRKNQFKKRRW